MTMPKTMPFQNLLRYISFQRLERQNEPFIEILFFQLLDIKPAKNQCDEINRGNQVAH
jgi:hypothetical protein